MKLILSFEASDPDWFKDNPFGILVVDVHDEEDKEKVVDGVCQAVSDYKDQEINWNYQDAIASAYDWLCANCYISKLKREIVRIDLG